MCCDGIAGPDPGQLSDSSRRDCMPVHRRQRQPPPFKPSRANLKELSAVTWSSARMTERRSRSAANRQKMGRSTQEERNRTRLNLGRGGEEANGGREVEGARDDEVEVGENIEGFAMLSVSRSMLLLTSYPFFRRSTCSKPCCLHRRKLLVKTKISET